MRWTGYGRQTSAVEVCDGAPWREVWWEFNSLGSRQADGKLVVLQSGYDVCGGQLVESTKVEGKFVEVQSGGEV